MAFTSDIQYIYPPNFEEGTDTMNPNQRKIAVRVTGTSDDATAPSGVVIDKSDLLGPAGAEPSKLVIEELEWSVQGFDYVTLLWDHGTDQEIARLSGAGFKDYSHWGGLIDDGSGGLGDLILGGATPAASGGNFDISIVARLKA